MSKTFYILLFAILGFILTPSSAFACGTKTEKSCCKKMSSVEKIKKECCKKSESSKKNSHEGCDGACKSIGCSNSTVLLSSTAILYNDLNIELFSFSTEKQNYYYSAIFISSDFRSVWLPPKIS